VRKLNFKEAAMAKIKLDTMLEDVSNRLGNVVYSEWKGIKYAKKYVKAKDANSAAQGVVRSSFKRTIHVWKLLPSPVKEAWNFHVKGRPLTGYNLFFMSNFNYVKNGDLLELSRGNGITVPRNLSASISAAGEISVSFDLADDAVQVSLFVQNMAEQDMRKLIIFKPDVSGGAMPVVLTGFDPQGDYNVYAVASSTVMDDAEAVSDSAGCKVVK